MRHMATDAKLNYIKMVVEREAGSLGESSTSEKYKRQYYY